MPEFNEETDPDMFVGEPVDDPLDLDLESCVTVDEFTDTEGEED